MHKIIELKCFVFMSLSFSIQIIQYILQKLDKKVGVMKRIVRFPTQQIVRIEERFNQFAQNGKMNLQQFKTSMGLLGIGQGEVLCQRIFKLITKKTQATFDDFIQFLDTITNGSMEQKSQISFCYLDRTSKGYINYDDIEVIISEISFLWHFLTGQKISNAAAIQFICGKLGINQKTEIGQNQYYLSYDQQFNWFQYFNHKLNPSTTQFLNFNSRLSKPAFDIIKPKQEKKKQEFQINQLQEYLKVVKSQMQNMLIQLKNSTEDLPNQQQTKSLMWELSIVKGPVHLSQPQFKHKGDYGFKIPQNTEHYIKANKLQEQLTSQGNNQIQIITNKLQQLAKMSDKLLNFKHQAHDKQIGRRISKNRFSYVFSDQQKKTILNKTQPTRKRVNIVYFGHQSWNLMLNVMLGVRKSLKQHYYIYSKNVEFSQQDLTCKYMYQNIYKKNNKSVKNVCQTFIDYSPKIFFYIRKYFEIDNQQFLKSIGLQNLIGNLLLGNLSTLTDQTSQGKSGSFMYYTQDSKIIVKSISRQQYKKFRQILKEYVQYVGKNLNTFLVRIYGLYKLKNKSTNRQIYFVVLSNVFDKGVQIHQRYDIKGSTYHRQIINQDTLQVNKCVALKDVDLINNHSQIFDIQKSLKEKIYNQIVRDAEFLSSHNIIEYSLLIGIHKCSENERRSIYENIQNKQTRIFEQIWNIQHNQRYFFGIIDIFSQYTVKKVFQNHFFHTFGKDISCMSPQDYFKRFQNFIYKYIFSS